MTALAAGPELALAGLDDGTGTRLFWSSEGTAWTEAESGLPDGALVASLAVRGALALASTYGDGVFGSTDRGRSWHATGRGLPASASVLAFVAFGRGLWAGTRAHGVFRSGDGGASWSSASTGLPWDGEGLEVLALAATPGGVVASHALGLHRSADGGRSWEPLSLGPHRGPALGLVATSEGTLVAGFDGEIVRSPDGGQTWVSAVGRVAGVPIAVAGRTLFASVNGRFARSEDRGAAWQPYDEGLPAGTVVEHVAQARGALLMSTLAHGMWRRDLSAVIERAGAFPPGPSPALDGGDPNPFHDATTVAFHLPRAADVVLAIDDGSGAEIARLEEGDRPAGRHRTPFRAHGLPVGLYTARLDVEGHRLTRVILRL